MRASGIGQPPPNTPQAPGVDPVHARAPVFSPGTGPPGTTVTVSTRDLPALTPIYLGIGATRSSFEVLVELVTDERGEMSQVVEIPAWATSDRTHFFVLVDVYFRPLAVSEAFHVTDPDGAVTRRGRVTDEDTGCVVLIEEESDEVYSLTGATAGLVSGDTVRVVGTVADAASRCRRGTTLVVSRVEPA